MRYTGKPAYLPVGLRVGPGGVEADEQSPGRLANRLVDLLGRHVVGHDERQVEIARRVATGRLPARRLRLGGDGGRVQRPRAAEREQREGASGKWVAHWKMVHIVRPVWEKSGQDNQLGRSFPPLTYTPADADALFLLAESLLPRKEVILVSDFQRGGWQPDDTLRLPGGIEFAVPSGEIRAKETLKTSLMPDGLESVITAQEAADLLARIQAK